MKANIDASQAKQIYARRLGTLAPHVTPVAIRRDSAGVVEPVFANICVHKHMHRFTLRTQLKVDVQWTRTRFALVHNIGKIHTFGALH